VLARGKARVSSHTVASLRRTTPNSAAAGSATPGTAISSAATTHPSIADNSPSRNPGPTNDPLGIVRSYWNSISGHNFAAAYADLVPGGIGLTRDQFVSAEQGYGIQSVQFSGHVASHNASAATVAVDSLSTTDRQYGCRTWSGSYQVVQQEGEWLIQHANLAPQSCA
jgi:hypothetical protein